MAGHPADPDRAGGPPRRARGRRRRGAALAGRRRYDGAAAAGESPLPSAAGPFDGRGGAPMRLWALRNRLRELFGLPPVPPRPGSAVVPAAPRVEVAMAGAVPGAVVRLLPSVLVVAGAALSGATGLAWYLTALAAHVAWRSLVEAGVLLRGARTVLGTQAIAQSVLLLVAWIVVLGTVVPY